MAQISRPTQKRSRQYARITGLTYSQALAEVESTPTAVRDGVIWQPLRDMERGEPAVIVGPGSIVNALVDSICDQLDDETPVHVFRLDEYSPDAAPVMNAVRTARSMGQIIAVVDDSPQLMQTRSRAGLSLFIPAALRARLLNLSTIAVGRPFRDGGASFEDGPVYIFDDAEHPTAHTPGRITARSVLRDLKQDGVAICNSPAQVRKAASVVSAPEVSVFPPTVYHVGADADADAVATAQCVALLGQRVNMGVVCSDPGVAERIGVPGTIIHTDKDGESTVAQGNPASWTGRDA